MPGILPMKVIKVGSNNQARIAQACDRCRSKKIRCDGVRPSCTQCLNVGFECKTSDKLSRRAFPRGYTESLEERVRLLESEVRELKELLDEKDEKIDMLSRIHSHSSPPNPAPRRSPSAPVSTADSRDEAHDKEDSFKVQQSPLLLDDENRDTYCVGGSSGRTFIESFKQRAQETGRSCSDVNSNAFFGTGSSSKPSPTPRKPVTFKAPPRLVSDQMINIFFQEWAPLFPVLHRPTFLSLYEQYVAGPEAVTDKKSIAKLNLVFGIAALSSDPRDGQDVDSFEAQWHGALEVFVMDNDIATLQCLVLAQMYCLLKADYSRLLKYKGLAIGLSQRLGLHQSQKRFALGALASETRKKVFWTLYAVDCFSAAHLGLPRLLREEDVHCEYPVDADDEYVTEKGFLPSLPGESTKLSSALALFRLSRVLSKVLTDLYPASATHEISFRAMASLAEHLDEWSDNLAPHLKLIFQQGKPSTNVTGSRSPILSLAYHHIRSLIYRPAVMANLGDKASSAMVAVGDSCKHIVQIVQLLDERKLSFSFCLNRNEVLVQAGFGLLFQTLNLDRDGKLIKDCNRLACAVMDMLDRGTAAGAHEFRRVGCSMIAIPRTEQMATPALSRHSIDSSMAAPMDRFRATQKSLKAIAARFSPNASKANLEDPREPRRATFPTISSTNQSSTSLSSIHSEPALSPLSHRQSLSTQVPPSSKHHRPSSHRAHHHQHRNIDFLSFGPDPLATYGMLHPNSTVHKTDVSPQDWERLLSSLDNGQTNIYDSIYGGPPADALLDLPPLSASADSSSAVSWGSASPNTALWNWAAYGVVGGETGPPPTQSVLSFSDESLTSGEEFVGSGGSGSSGVEYGGASVSRSSGSERLYAGIVIPGDLGGGMGIVGADATFGL